MGNPVPLRRPAPVVRAEYELYLRESRLNNWRVNCEDPKLADEFVDVTKHTPTDERAAELCNHCPMLSLCREYAQVQRPSGVVLGGQVWADRKVRKPQVEADNGEIEMQLPEAA